MKPSAISAADLMSPHVLKINIDLPFTDACRLFFQMKIHHLPVVDEAGHLVGMLSTNDAFEAYSNGAERMSAFSVEAINTHFSVEELMSTEPVVVQPDTDLREITRLFMDLSLHAVPVVDQGRLVGIVTANDVLNHYAQNV
ncbi:MAG: CBS domain-containing protein [Phaeodactylibacter sp.]|nr:CBS domain-containing protein [Phaeodactylibacter sp.]